MRRVSEYQYYEFAALDHTLDEHELAGLRAISTRASITPTGFVSTYEWGDLKADPRRLVERYFDAFLYLSNWGTHRLMLRVPAVLLDEQSAARYCVSDAASTWTSGEHTIVDLVAEVEDGVFEEDWSYGVGEGRLASIVPARTQLLAGDRSLLYLAWLLCVQAGEVPDDEVEPPVPARLDRPTASVRAAATFLRIDEDLLAVAASGSADDDEVHPLGEVGLGAWLASVPESEKDAMLLSYAVSGPYQARAQLLTRFRAATPTPDHGGGVRRSVGVLLSQAQARKHDREHVAQQHRARRAAERDRAAAVAHEKRLATLAGEQEPAWQRIDQLIAARKPAEYAAAVAMLADLREVNRSQDRLDAYDQRVARLRLAHHRKTTFIERLDRGH